MDPVVHAGPEAGKPSAGPGAGAGGGADAAAAARAAQFVIRHEANEMALEYFAAGVCGLLGFFIVCRLVRRSYQRATRFSARPALRTIAYPFASVTRYVVPKVVTDAQSRETGD